MENVKLQAVAESERRAISEIIIHCSATPEGRNVSVGDIDRYHRQRGFAGIGYHYVIELDGAVRAGRDERRAGAHCIGHNARSIGVCYVGGVDSQMRPRDTRTSKQRQSLCSLVELLRKRYAGASVHGHCEFAAKACPSFNVKDEF